MGEREEKKCTLWSRAEPGHFALTLTNTPCHPAAVPPSSHCALFYTLPLCNAAIPQAYELFSHEADTGMVIPAASRLKNVQWDTQTVLFGWASQGTWPPELDGTEVDWKVTTL